MNERATNAKSTHGFLVRYIEYPMIDSMPMFTKNVLTLMILPLGTESMKPGPEIVECVF